MSDRVTDLRGEGEQQPMDGKDSCGYCNSMRFVIDVKGKLKGCPICNKYVSSKQQDMEPEHAARKAQGVAQ